MRIISNKKNIFLIWFVGFGLGSSNFIMAETLQAPEFNALGGDSFNVEQAIQTGDHQGLAEYYRTQAKVQREAAASHERMKYTYRMSHGTGKGGGHRPQLSHCLKLKDAALKSAKNYEALAEIEQGLAKK